MFSTRSLATHFCFRDCGLQNNVRLSLHLLWNVTLGVRNETNRISFKPYPCCRCTHPVIDAALALSSRSDYGDPAQIESVTIRLPPHSFGQIGRPFVIRDEPTVDAQFSAAYASAIGLSGDRPQLTDFRADTIVRRRDRRSIASLVVCKPFMPESSGVTPVEMTVRMKDGRAYEERVDHASGSPERQMSADELFEKFVDCAGNSSIQIGARGAADIFEKLSLTTDVYDMRYLLSLLV